MAGIIRDEEEEEDEDSETEEALWKKCVPFGAVGEASFSGRAARMPKVSEEPNPKPLWLLLWWRWWWLGVDELEEEAVEGR